MSKASVCHGDPTTTGGKVIATASTMFDGDRRIALDQETATCGNCPGSIQSRVRARTWTKMGEPVCWTTILSGARAARIMSRPTQTPVARRADTKRRINLRRNDRSRRRCMRVSKGLSRLTEESRHSILSRFKKFRSLWGFPWE